MSETEQSERIYQVTGMTCSHCVAAVKEEVSALDGAEEVAVDLESGRLTIRGRDVRDADVRAAVEEAGYSLA